MKSISIRRPMIRNAIIGGERCGMPKMATIGVMRWQMRDRGMRDQAYLVNQFSLAASLTFAESLDSLEP